MCFFLFKHIINRAQDHSNRSPNEAMNELQQNTSDRLHSFLQFNIFSPLKRNNFFPWIFLTLSFDLVVRRARTRDLQHLFFLYTQNLECKTSKEFNLNLFVLLFQTCLMIYWKKKWISFLFPSFFSLSPPWINTRLFSVDSVLGRRNLYYFR